MSVSEKRTLYDKIWDSHIVETLEDGTSLLYIDRHLVHEVTSPQAFEGLRLAGRRVRRPDCTLATVDHNTPTVSRKSFRSLSSYVTDPEALAQCQALDQNVAEFGLTYFNMQDKRQGIVHVIGPEQGFTVRGTFQSHGAFGCLAFGIGTSEVEHVLATQCLLQTKSKNMRINIDGALAEGVTSKDVILHIIGEIGAAGASGTVIEYTGSAIRSFSMEARMSICNMSIEAGARAGMIAPDDVTFAYLRGRPFAPQGRDWERAVAYWKTLRSDDGAEFDLDVDIRAEAVTPTVTWGTSPQDVVSILGRTPDPAQFTDANKRKYVERALQYMGLAPSTPMQDITVNKVFIGSCTNGRIEDLRSAAMVVLAAGPTARVREGVHAMVVPGSGPVKVLAEAEGLDVVFQRAGFDWREPGCSLCCGLADTLGPEERCASTTNRNFEGRQGPRSRTHLLSPAMAAAAALAGKLIDVRRFLDHATNTGPALHLAASADAYSKTASEEHDHDRIQPASRRRGKAARRPKDTAGTGPLSIAFKTLKGIAAPLYIPNVDTDVLIPAMFVKTLKRTGLADFLFFSLRNDTRTGTKPTSTAKILVCDMPNFGCGSSREHAAWALKDFGILCVIAPSFGEIFQSNCMQNGMLPIVLPTPDCQALAADAEEGSVLEVDLDKQEIRRGEGRPPITFAVDPLRRHRLLNGLDDITLTLQREDAIASFEERRTELWPWLDGFDHGGAI
ncbi:aconitase [Fomitopsis serialis]|uniref:aconitase n=1 Tax=Fomitopsis serialis TaxID=139415 RepID=UPI002007AD2D|nr:aconitase [Neoantrodia serialis]KAH9934365.1 aconitase [Neoantrodia serialis]